VSKSIKLCGDGVSEATLAELADSAGCAIVGGDCAAGAPDDDSRLAVIVGDVDEERLSRALRAPVAACIEADGGLEPVFAAIPERGLLVSLTTVTAYGLEVARALCQAVAERTSLDENVHQVMELALHEALVNAMVHGNLEIGSLNKDSLDDFIQFCQTIETRLNDGHFGGRRVTILTTWDDGEVVVTIDDEGPGYDAAILDRPIDLNKKSGRGLFLIRDICKETAMENGGRRLVMRFAR